MDKEQTSALFDCIHRAWVYDTPLSDEVLPFVKQLIADERRAAAAAMRERLIVHFIDMGAMGIVQEIQSLPLDTTDDGRG